MTEQTEEKKDTPIYSLSPVEFKRFFDQQDLNDIEYTIKCYRVSRKKGHTYKTWLKDFVDVCPTEQEIAEEYGGGNFWLVSWDNDGQKVERSMWIDEIWSKRLDENKKVEGGRPADPQPRIDPLEYMSKILNDVLKPMMLVVGNNNQPAPTGGDASIKFIERLTESMAKSLGKLQSAVIDQQLEKIEHKPAAPAEVPEDRISFIREILDVAKEFGNQLINANPVKSKIYEAAIKSDERFKEIEKDPDLFDALYTEAVNDPDIGKEKADKLFKKLGFEIGDGSGERE